MCNVTLIRHGATQGNLLKKYIGSTDEVLTVEGVNHLMNIQYPKVDIVYSSPLIRAMETARIIYPDNEILIKQQLCECSFGEFENKNYIQLSDNENYKKWVSSNGQLPFPGGEDIQEFKFRAVNAFLQVIKENEMNKKNIAIITHGGVIMSIMEKLAVNKKSFYQWHLENGGFYSVSTTINNKLIIIKKG